MLEVNHFVTSDGFTENIIDQCMYLKVSGSTYIFTLLYVEDILLASSDIDLLYDTKQFVSQNFEMNGMGKASYIINIEIHRDMSKWSLRLSHKVYNEKILKR